MADLNKPYKITEKVNGILEKKLSIVEPKFVKQVTEWITKFQTSSGNIVRTKANRDRMASFKTAIERYLERAGYYDMISQYLTGFDAMAEAQKEIQQDLNAISLTQSFLNQFKRVAIKQVVDNMTKQGLMNALINPIRNELNIAVNQGSSLTDVVTSIRGQLSTNEKRQGILKKLSLQSTRDALGQYDGTVNEAVRKTYKLDALLYVGSLVKDSRPQCERWTQYEANGKRGLILFEQLEDEILWADANGTGMIPNTTPENFCQNRGGYNCRHVAYPVRNPNKITQAGNVAKNVDPEITKKEQQEAIQQLKVPVVKLGFDEKFDEMINDSDFVLDEAKILIDRLPKPNSIKTDEKEIIFQRSYFDSTTNNIVIAENKSSDTLLHEYGHFISNLGKGQKLSSQINTIDDWLHQQKIFKDLDIDFVNGLRYVKSRIDGFDYENFKGPLQDMFDALYGGNAQSLAGFIGHGREYYSIDGNIQEELFANLFQIYSLKNNEDAIKLVKEFFPSINNKFLEILNNL